MLPGLKCVSVCCSLLWWNKVCSHSNDWSRLASWEVITVIVLKTHHP